MRRWKDPFPPTPERFHLGVERALENLEERNMNGLSIKRRLLPLVAALLALLLAATAAAAIRGRSGLKERMEQEGADEVAALVQEPHLSAGAEADFNMTVDEIIWEDADLYISCSLSAPDEGKYLAAVFNPTLNGEKLAFDAKGFSLPKFFDSHGDGAYPALLLLGGAHGRTCADLWTFRVDPKLRDRKDNHLKFRAVLLRTDSDLEGGTNLADLPNPPDAVYLDPRWRENDPGETGESETAFLDAAAAAFGDDGTITLDALVAAGLGEVVSELELDMTLDASLLDQTLYNDVAERDFDVDGVRLHVDRFRMTHLGARIEYTLSVPGSGLDDREAMGKLNALLEARWSFGTPDGHPLGWSLGGSGSGGLDASGDTVRYRMVWEDSAILPLADLDRILYAPVTYQNDADGNQMPPEYDMARAITLTPTYNPDAPAPEPALSPEEETATEDHLSE